MRLAVASAAVWRRVAGVVGSVLLLLSLGGRGFATEITTRVEKELFGGGILDQFLPLVNDSPILSLSLQPIVAADFSAVKALLTNEVFSEIAVIPLTSGSTGFVYEFNPAMDIFERRTIGLGTVFNEKASPLGKGRVAFGFTHTHIDFDEFNGEDISGLRIRPGLFAEPQDLGLFINNGTLTATLELDVEADSFSFWATYGVTEWLDVNATVPLVRIDFRARSTIRVNPLTEDVPGFITDEAGALDFVIIPQGTVFPFSSDVPGVSSDGLSVVNRIKEEKFGIGDIVLRGKARLWQGRWGRLAGLAELLLPSGNEDNFLGEGAVKARFLGLYSQSFLENRLNLHFNGGVKLNGDTSDKLALDYGSTLDVKLLDRLSLVAEFLGSWRPGSEGLPSLFLDGVFGFKANPWAGLILSAVARIPANDDGLRSDVMYTIGMEYDL